MRNSSQIVGIGLVAVGSILAIAIGGWLVAGLVSSDLEAGGAILGGIFGFIFLVAPLIGVGSFILVRSRSESRQMDQVALQRQLLARIELAGEIGIADLALEVGLTRDEVRANLVDLVSKASSQDMLIGIVDGCLPDRRPSSGTCTTARAAAAS
ncbi:MAG: hypothetical protein R2849_13235 [Thermomicrobiales bacterium]